MKKQRKLLALVLAVIAATALSAICISADTGQKPSITIKTNGTVGEKYYLDLLVKYADGNPNLTETESAKLNPEMFGKLSGYTDDGWYPAIAHGTRAPLFGTVVPDDNGTSRFSYFGTPDRFKIIIVTESGVVKVSDVIEKTVFQQVFSLDFADMTVVTSQSPAKSYLIQFASTFFPTLIIEFLLLFAFGLSPKKYWWAVIAVNLATQLLLTSVIACNPGIMYSGFIFLFVMLELLITVIEAVAYVIIMKKERLWKRIVYAVTANIVSATVGGILLTIVGSYI